MIKLIDKSLYLSRIEKITLINSLINTYLIKTYLIKLKMTPIFKCLICRKDIERSTSTFWRKKGHLLCSSCFDNIDLNTKKNL